MNNKKFNNRPNDRIRIQSSNVNIDYWISRAPAVVGMIFAKTIEGTKILVIKRSKNMRNEPNKYGAPSGFLDWNESGYDGMMREVYEETSLYIPDYEKYVTFSNDKKPFMVIDDPNEDKNQNISLFYIIMLDFTIENSNIDLCPYYIENYKNKETSMVCWLHLSDFQGSADKDLPWAFNHNDKIHSAINYYIKNKHRNE